MKRWFWLALWCGCQASSGGGSLSGKVVVDGEPDHGGVIVTLAGPRSAVTATASDGSYGFADLPGGSYLVAARAEATRERVLSVTISADQSVIPELRFHPVGELNGRVTRSGSAAGNGGIVVLASGSSGVTTTDDSGGFTLRDLAPGSYQLYAFTSGFLPGTARDLPVARGKVGEVPQLDLQAAQTGGLQPGELRGQARLTGVPDLAGIEVTLEGTAEKTVTDAAGGFVLPNPPDGIYALRFDKGEFHERVPEVLAIPDASGFYVDGALYPLSESILALARAKRQASGRLVDVRLSPNGDRVLWKRNDAGVAQPYYGAPTSLWSLPATGGSPVSLATRVGEWKFSPDGTRVAYAVGPDGNYAWEIYVAPIAGGSTTLVAKGVQPLFTWSPDGSLIFHGGAPYTSELHVVSASGGVATKLGVNVGQYFPSADSVLVMANCVQQYYGLWPCELVRMPVTGGGSAGTVLATGVVSMQTSKGLEQALLYDSVLLRAIDLASGVITPLYMGNIQGALLTPDGSRAVFASGPPNVPPDLYGVVTAGPSPSPYPLALATPGGFRLSPNGTQVYLDPAGSNQIRMVPAAGGPIEILGTTQRYLSAFKVSPKGTWVAVLTDLQPASDTVTLHLMPAEGGTMRLVASDVLQKSILFSDDDAQIAYVVDDGHFGARGWLEIAPTVGGPELRVAGEVQSLTAFSPGGTRLLFRTNELPAGTLWTVPAAGGSSVALIEQTSRAFFSGEGRVFSLRTGSPKPFSFQDGLYLSELP